MRTRAFARRTRDATARPRSWFWRPGPAPACGRTPRRCCTPWRAAACCRTRCTRWPRSAPQHLVVVVLGQDRDQVAPAVAELADELGRADRDRGAGAAARHRPRRAAAACRRCPTDFTGIVVVTSGDVPLLDADTLADLIAAHSAESAAATVLTTTLPDPTGYGRILRTQDGEVIGIVEQADATPSQRAIREVNAGVYAFDIAALRSALSRLRSDNAQQELYLTDVDLDRARRRARSCGPSTSTTPRWSPASTTGCSWPSWAPSSTGASSPRISAPGVTIVDPATTWIDVDVDHRPRHRRPARHPAARRHPHRRPLRDRPGHHADRRHRRRRRRRWCAPTAVRR